MNYQINTFEEYLEIYKYSIENPEGFWAEIASNFFWHKKWDKVLEWNFTEPEIKWFLNAKLNITENCLDRHLADGGEKTAIIWEPNNPDENVRKITYKQLYTDVCLFANVLKSNGAKKGDRICIYMPMIPELVIAMLACARIGAIHSVVFGGFSAKSIADRVEDAGCRMLITADGVYRGAKLLNLKGIVDEALINDNLIKKVIVFKNRGINIKMQTERDIWWHDEIEIATTDCKAEIMDSEDMLYILYTSGSTGKPKGVVHTCGGYMVYTAYTFSNVFQYKSNEIFFCTADIGWVTGHSYIVYGPLLSGATCLMFEGIPTYPDSGRLWEIVEKHKVNILYTAPTAIRSLMQAGTEFVRGKDLSSLSKLGSVGEPINEEAWHWYNENIGNSKCPIADTWWQTETGGILISPIAGISPTKPSYAMLPLPGIQPAIVNAQGEELFENNISGDLCIKFPWPGILRTTYNNHERCRTNYFETYKNMYYTGDGCLRDKDGFYRITGRADDVLKVSGHRIGTAEVENAIDLHHKVIESAVVGFPHHIKGQGIYAFVICNNENTDSDKLRTEIIDIVTKEIGSFAKPEKIQFVNGLPKTRSGKIMRRILRKIAEGETENLGDTTTLLDPTIVEEIKTGSLSLA
ncbi:MAG: acetate--CoA ligase [Bacteroidetes bacterium]|nr:acetate--CoA ligase [Bacteroidota bacterium]